MAVIVKELWVDDLDGTEADRTVRFSIDKKNYVMDLSEMNYARLMDALQPYIDAGRVVPAPPRAKRGTAKRS